MQTLHCLNLVYSQNYFNLPKIFVLRLFKMLANQKECSRLELKPVIKFLLTDKCKPYKIYRMWDLYGETYLQGAMGNQTGNISTLNNSSLKLVDKLTYLRNSVSSTETDSNTQLAKAWTAIDRLSVIWKSDLTDKMKCSFFQAAVVLQISTCTATYHPSRKLWKLDKPDMRDTSGEVGMSS